MVESVSIIKFKIVVVMHIVYYLRANDFCRPVGCPMKAHQHDEYLRW